jgi:hypothetical protein
MALLEERVNEVEERTDRLETLFGQFMVQTGIAIRRLERSVESIDRSIERMEATVAEMKAEGARDREEAARAREAAREEVTREREAAREEAAREREAAREEAVREREAAREEAAREREAAQEEAARERREMNKKWGELANKMGTIVEDIIAPSLRRMAQEEFGCGQELLFAERLSRVRSDDPGRRREFDALYIGEKAVLLNETKATARSEYAVAFVEFLDRNEFALYFPEYQNLPIVPVFSSLHIPPDLVMYLTRHNIYAVAMGDESMQILNWSEMGEPSV